MCNSAEHRRDTRTVATDGSVTVPESYETPARQWALLHDGKIRAAGWFSTERSEACRFPEGNLIVSLIAIVHAYTKGVKNEK